MTTVAYVGDHNLKFGLEELGLDLRHIPLPQPRTLTWDDVTAEAGAEPDLFIYADQSLPPPLLGVERFPCPTVFYCVDSHIHTWYPYYAQAFDLCAVSLKDHLEGFRLRLTDEELLWLPPVPHPQDLETATGQPKEWDLLFVGKVDQELTPKRYELLTELGRRLDGLHVTQGAYRELFPRARLLLNISEHGDLNFRVFEGLACGGCLITPRVGHGLTELFTPGEHLFTYDQDDVDGLVELVGQLLPDDGTRERVAAQGRAEVLAKHTPKQRAKTFWKWVQARPLQRMVDKRLAAAGAIHDGFLKLLYLHWAESAPALAPGYIRAARS